MRGQTVVAINGLGGLAYLWQSFAAALPPRFSLRVLDLAGHGELPPAAEYGYNALVEDISARTADLAAFPLIGWSVGGAVAWLFAARYPQRVSHLVLLDPAAPHQSPFRHGPIPEPVHAYTYASLEKAVGALSAIFPRVTADDIRALYQQNAAGRWEPRFDPRILPALVIDARDHGEEMFFELQHIRAPVLLLRGQDSFVPESQVQELVSALPNAVIESVPNAGHFMVREQPEYLATRIGTFLSVP